MIKEVLKRATRKLGLYVASTGRLGIDVELDLARLTLQDPIATVFDVGANFGQTACRFAEAFPGASIFSFEPVPSSFVRLVAATRENRRIRPFNLALGEVPGTARIMFADSAGRNSFVRVPSVLGGMDVQIDTVDHVAAQYSVERIDLLKLDVEGYELQALRGARQLISQQRIRYVFAECVLSPNPEMPHTSFFVLHQFLDQAGFCFVSYYAESFNLRLGCAHGNVLYAQRSILPKTAVGRVRNIY
jgi:FkbM family methyltransferase